jgi:hypothetical protein
MSFGRHLRMGLLALLVAVVGVGQAVAQDANATVSGTVADEQGQVLPGATVTLTNEATKLARTGASDARGDFRFTNLLPGNYSVKVELQGFKAFERRNNVLNAASTLSVGTVKLALGALTEVVVVEDSGSKVNVEETQHSGLLTSTQIEQLQSKGRDIVNLLRAIPGVRYGEDTDSLGDSFGSDIPNISGQRNHWNRATIDGMNANESGGGGKMGSAVSLDAIAEVKVLLNTYRAEFGGTGGANIQIVTKTGGSDYRGSVYYLARRTGWNANRWENNKALQPGTDCDNVPEGRERPAGCRPEYNFNTYGFNISGPVPLGQKDKLFFFYNSELPFTKRSGALMRWQMPTEAERRGDFSQSLVYGQTVNRVTVLDPVTGVQFPNNIIPANMIDRNMQALMNLYPLPNTTDLSITKGQYNYIRQGLNDNPRQNHILRLDWKPNERDSLYISGRLQRSLVQGVDTPGTSGNVKWGLYDSTYDFGDAGINVGYTRIFGAHLINEFGAGWRNQWEKFGYKTETDRQRLLRASNNYTLGQLFPAVNTVDLIPRVTMGNLTSTGVTAPNIEFPDRIGEAADDYIYNVRDNLTWTKNTHTIKAGFMFERLHQNEAPGGGPWMGSFNYDNANRNTNPVSSTVPYANFLMGTFRSYSENSTKQDTANRQSRFEWYVQDTWKASRRLTLDIGMRFLAYQHWYQDPNGLLHSGFVPERYVLGASPRQYIDGGGGVAVDPGNRSDVRRPGASFTGRFVPGSGDPGNGMVVSTDPSYPRGYRDSQGIHPEPSIGLAYDLFGTGKTNLHGGASLRHQGYMGGGYQGNLRGVPATLSVQLPNSTTALMLGSAGFQGPTNVRGLQRDNKTPAAYSFSLGVSQELGWGSVLDVSYVGVLNRHMEMVEDINEIPFGAKCANNAAAPCAIQTVIQTPIRTINTLNPITGTRFPDNLLRPYEGFGEINIHRHWATGNYNAMQAQLTRRYSKGLQFSLSYTFSKALGYGNDDGAEYTSTLPVEQLYSPVGHNQTHNLVFNFTYDFPKVGGPAPVKFVLGNWQMSGEYVWASGDWAGVTLDMNPDVDFTGGSNCTLGNSGTGNNQKNTGCAGGATPVMLRNPRKNGGSAFDPSNPWFDVDAFAAPSVGNLGNTPRTVLQLPPINSLNLSLFKNFTLGGRRRVQFRVEGYNVMNHTQIRDVGRTLQFNSVTGELTNRDTVGVVTTSNARNPRIFQASLRLNF